MFHLGNPHTSVALYRLLPLQRCIWALLFFWFLVDFLEVLFEATHSSRKNLVASSVSQEVAKHVKTYYFPWSLDKLLLILTTYSSRMCLGSVQSLLIFWLKVAKWYLVLFNGLLTILTRIWFDINTLSLTNYLLILYLTIT